VLLKSSSIHQIILLENHSNAPSTLRAPIISHQVWQSVACSAAQANQGLLCARFKV
jgi:hypothetical protein